jgi:hypothetical protein
MSKITVEKRNRIFEIIIGILLIIVPLKKIYDIKALYSIDPSYLLNFEILKFFVLPVIGILFLAFAGMMIMLRKYDALWLKIAFGITAAAAVFTSYGGMIIRGYFHESLYSMLTVLTPTFQKWIYIIVTIAMAAGAVVALLTMNGKIVWSSRHKLLTYTYFMIFLCAFRCIAENNIDLTSVIIFMFPCLMQKTKDKQDLKGIVGQLAMLVAEILPDLSYYIYKKSLEQKYNASLGDLANYSSSLSFIRDKYNTYSDILRIFLIALVLLIPLIIFERQVGDETESSENRILSKSKLNNLLFNNDEDAEEEDNEYEDEDEDDEDYEDDEYDDEEYEDEYDDDDT